MLPPSPLLAHLSLFIYGLHRIRSLRLEENTSSSLISQFSAILRDDPEQGVHTLIWCDSFSNFSRSVGQPILDEFELRIAFQMAENDSTRLIGSPEANRLGPHRALLFKDGEGTLEKFIPYEPPSDEWLTQAIARLRKKKLELFASAASNIPPIPPDRAVLQKRHKKGARSEKFFLPAFSYNDYIGTLTRETMKGGSLSNYAICRGIPAVSAPGQSRKQSLLERHGQHASRGH